MNAAMLMLVASTMAAPQPATNDLSVSPSFSMGHHATFATEAVPDDVDVDQTRPPGSPSSPTHQAGGKTLMIIAQGGIAFCCSTTGFVAGVGVGLMPIHDNDKIEIDADFNFIHFGGNGVYISFNGQYDIRLNNSNMIPFAGGGLGIAHAGGGTNTGLQIYGGIQVAMSSGRAVRVSIRFLFAGGATQTLIMGGFAF